jgi:hypothetical protein
LKLTDIKKTFATPETATKRLFGYRANKEKIMLNVIMRKVARRGRRSGVTFLHILLIGKALSRARAQKKRLVAKNWDMFAMKVVITSESEMNWATGFGQCAKTASIIGYPVILGWMGVIAYLMKA